MKLVARALVGLGFAALLAGVLLYVLQRRLLYFPRRCSEQTALGAAQRLGLAPQRDATGKLLGWRAHSSRVRAIALVLHGNAGSALDRIYYARALAPLGVEVILVEYPGYGPRAGTPSLESLTSAALEAIDLVASSGLPVWLVGESLGSGVAARAAALRGDKVRGVLLITPFADLAAVAHHHFPLIPTFLLRDRFRPAQELAHFRNPVAVLVAGRDEVVTLAEGRWLFDALPGPKKLFEQPEATHNGLDLAPEQALWSEAVRFLSGRE